MDDASPTNRTISPEMATLLAGLFQGIGALGAGLLALVGVLLTVAVSLLGIYASLNRDTVVGGGHATHQIDQPATVKRDDRERKEVDYGLASPTAEFIEVRATNYEGINSGGISIICMVKVNSVEAPIWRAIASFYDEDGRDLQSPYPVAAEFRDERTGQLGGAAVFAVSTAGIHTFTVSIPSEDLVPKWRGRRFRFDVRIVNEKTGIERARSHVGNVTW